VEASKISSGNITLNLEVLDLGELLQQTIGELSEKLEAAKLSVVAEIDEKPSLIYADSRRMWRVMENLFNNICKYAMEGTRVYAEVKVTDNARVLLQIKNVSKAQMNIHADELTERVIRGDSSRSTEGSGLGLYIAKSLTNVLGGNFEIQLDADLFKVNIDFPLYQQEKKE
jgi:signal transduction histidine kinase